MKKLHVLIVLLCAVAGTTALFAETYQDLGTDFALVITETPYAEAETNSASSVTVINREQIASWHVETTSQLIERAIGTSFRSYGALGAAQTVQIRGSGSDKTLVFLNGVPLGSAHDGSYDIAQIPVTMIERIEIIKSGPGNLGRTNAIGGMINIITTVEQSEKLTLPFTLQIENGSFLPLAYGPSDERNWLSLVDSQRIDLGYRTVVSDLDMLITLGGARAANAYTYTDAGERALRSGAAMQKVYGGLSLNGEFSPQFSYDSNSLVSWQRAGVPGSLTYPTQAEQEDFQVTSSHELAFESDPDAMLTEHIFTASASFAQTQYLGDTHNKVRIYSKYQQLWNLSKQFALETGVDVTSDYIDSTKLDQISRMVPSIYVHGGIYFGDGLFSLHPSAQLRYIHDTEVFSPNASLGLVYGIDATKVLKASISYAEQIPTFSQLYWPEEWGYHGNPDLQTEKGFNGDIGFTWEEKSFQYEGNIFGRNVDDAITGDPDDNYIPYNIAHAVFFGTEQTITYTPVKQLSYGLSYQYNRSFDLSGAHTFSDAVEVSSVRQHTAKASISYHPDSWNFSLFAEYLGATAEVDAAVLVNVSASVDLNDEVSLSVAIDNLLNTSYELYADYPMPGTKIRTSGTLRF